MGLSRIYCILCSFLLVFCHNNTIQSMQEHELDELVRGVEALQVNDYDSDSEDEENYHYNGLPRPSIPDSRAGKQCVALMRGIHFSPSKFDRQSISRMRRAQDAGTPLYAAAVNDIVDAAGNNENREEMLHAKAMEIRDEITAFSSVMRNRFQAIYTNQYEAFHQKLRESDAENIFAIFESKKNPQVSTAESFVHAAKYASGLKFTCEGVEFLDPEYDDQGKPKHPYLGKLFVILADTDQISEFDPYFVVHGHANNHISVSNHYSNNILEEREVSFAGLVPGECVIFSIPIRVPSFEGEYKRWYQEKFGISRRIYNYRKKIFTTGKYFKNETKDPEQVRRETVQSLLVKIILPHTAEQLKKHVERACGEKNIKLVYKQLNGEFGNSLPSLQLANAENQRIKQQEKRQQ